MCCRCTLTVLSDIPSRRAIFVFDSPSAARSITSRSRAVSILAPPDTVGGRTYFSYRPPQTQHEIRKGRMAFFGQNFGDKDFVVGCCIRTLSEAGGGQHTDLIY